MKHNIDDILNRYWDGDSTIEDEQVLKEYFSKGQVEPEHQAFSPLFAFFDEQSKITYSQPVKEAKVVTIRRHTFRKYMYAVAAVFVLGLTSIFVLNNQKNEQIQENTASVQEIEDPEEALKVTKQALAMLSKKFRNSQKTVRENIGELEKASVFK